MLLLKSQKNEIFDEIISRGLSPAQFEVNEDKKNNETIIKLINYDYWFRVEISESKKYVVYNFKPGEINVENRSTCNPKWDDVKKIIKTWLDYIKPDLEQPDKWSDFFNNSERLKISFNDGDEGKFSIHEFEEIKKSVETLKESIKLLGLNPSEIKSIQTKLDYLVEKAKTFNKIDWKNLVVGALLTITVTHAFTPEKIQEFANLVKLAFNNVLLLIF